jgi:membrane dipeptidase
MMLFAVVAAALAAPTDDAALHERVDRVLARTPLIDGHNDVPWQVRERLGMALEQLTFSTNTADLEPPMHTDVPRLREGHAGGVFWSVWVPTEQTGAEAALQTLEQIDLVHQMVLRWPDTLAFADTADDIVRLHKAGKVASLVGIEGGHSIGDSLGALRAMYVAGARYMTLTHWTGTDWADAATSPPKHGGLTGFGEQVVREMNRLGMLVDLSHVSADTMRDALAVTQAPVIFSHSGAYGVNPHPRNVPDDVLDLLPKTDGVVMVVFLPAFVSAEVRNHGASRRAEEGRQKDLCLGDPDALDQAMKEWDAAHPEPRATLAQVADHADYIKKRIGAQHVGIGSDFDGMGQGPLGLEDVSKTPDLLVELARRGWTDEELAGIAGANLLRVFRRAEVVAAGLRKSTMPSNLRITPALTDEH